MNYSELQKAVFDHLWKKHEADDEFTFSVRQKASKGAERNYFIGKEKSSYFGFTCWDTPVYYPGSSSDLTNFIFTVKGRCFLKFQYIMTKSQTDPQSMADLAFGYALLKNLKEANVPVTENDEKNKSLYFDVTLAPNGFEKTEDVLKDLDELYALVSPLVDQSLAKVKSDYPEWTAGRYTRAKFDNLIQKMHLRLERFAAGTLPSTEIDDENEGPVEASAVGFPSYRQHALNTILYGPPGTGKTYHTIDKAVQLVAPEFYAANQNNREALKEKFRSFTINNWGAANGQIAFVTFHQSMSYEDFIEGIKPVEPRTGESLSYDIVDGVFKSLCKLAHSNFESSRATKQQKLPFEEAFALLKDEWEDTPSMKFPLKTEGYDFTITGFTNTSIQFRKSNGSTSHTLSINTLKELYYGKMINFNGGVSIYYPAILKKLNGHQTKPESPIKKQNYVLIIDEINRGNIAQIFGELITMIEDDKRFGNKEAVEVMLPYSKEAFSVPSNVYIIGTMNTADRSVEALDTALRRRFVFEEMLPQPELLSPAAILARALNSPIWEKQGWGDKGWRDLADPLYELLGTDQGIEQELKVLEEKFEDEEAWQAYHFAGLDFARFDGVNLQVMLETINRRLEALLSKDHTIGHAWLMNVGSVADLRNVFRNKVLPLLQEYFFNSYAKIGLVLGDRFFQQQTRVDRTIFASFKNAADIVDDYGDKTLYRFRDTNELSVEDFQSIYS